MEARTVCWVWRYQLPLLSSETNLHSESLLSSKTNLRPEYLPLLSSETNLHSESLLSSNTNLRPEHLPLLSSETHLHSVLSLKTNLRPESLLGSLPAVTSKRIVCCSVGCRVEFLRLPVLQLRYQLHAQLRLLAINSQEKRHCLEDQNPSYPWLEPTMSLPTNQQGPLVQTLIRQSPVRYLHHERQWRLHSH